jgi:predicted XRE-type DNA-binding protein
MELRTKTINGEVVEESSGNVFADLGFPNPEEHLVKVELVTRIDDLLKARELTQAQASKLLRVKQPDLSNMLRGRGRGYSVHRLLRFLAALDQDVRIVIQPAQRQDRKEARGTISVVTL